MFANETERMMQDHDDFLEQPPPVTVERLDRRHFMVRLGQTTAFIMVTGASVGTLFGCQRAPAPVPTMQPGEGERWSSQNALPNADAAVLPVEGTRPELTPLEDHYRMFNYPDLPTHTLDDWQLSVGGLVEEPFVWTLDAIMQPDPLHAFVTLTCISNPVGGPLTSTTRWTGTSLQQLLPQWNLKPEATHLKIHGADGFYEVVALETIRADERVMLVYAWDGVPLPMDHGFPLRIYIPDRYGMKQPKWITSIEATDHWEAGFSVAKTWDKDAIMETTSVIDTVVIDKATPGTNASLLIGGIAHAGARGISKVEVQVDGGDWEEAQLRMPLSELTWVLWRYAWPFQEGAHTIAVRAYDGRGQPQEVEPSPPYPDGATGIHQVTETV